VKDEVKVHYFFGILLILAILISAICFYPHFAAQALNFSISKVKSGLVISEPLNGRNLTADDLRWLNTHGWNFDVAELLQNGSSNFYQDAEGLHLGIKAAPIKGEWDGFYAMTPPTNATLFHVKVTVPFRSTSNGEFFESGLYIHTSEDKVNYITCFASVSPTGITWTVQHDMNNPNQGMQYATLWSDNNTSVQPHSKDCTIITNGNNYLKVYIDNTQVYLNDHASLQMPSPLKASLEVSTSNNSSSQFRYGIFNDFYSTTDEHVKIINGPSNGSVKIVQTSPSSSTALLTRNMQIQQTPSNKTNNNNSVPLVGLFSNDAHDPQPSSSHITTNTNVLENGTLDSQGVSKLDIGQYHFPLNAQIQVYNSTNSMVASTPQNISLYGGDIYSVKINK
jgi:hypothetical protein